MFKGDFARTIAALFIVMAMTLASSTLLFGQTPAQTPPQQHVHGAPAEKPDAPPAQAERQGSGTAWLPDNTPMHAVHAQRGPWQWMAHGNAFVQFLHESGERGDSQTGSINWAMGMGQRPLGRGRLTVRGMVSAEPWTIGGCGYPDLLASGEQCDGEQIHDRQHPHDLIMEISAQYDAPLRGSTRWQLYGGPAGEPALGPVAYPHRLSAMPNPLAPITHHWFDSTHITFGVVTAGIYGPRWKAEASAFNGREPDDERTDFDFGALDSVSGRLWFLPTANLALQVSAGTLTEAEAGEHGGPRIDVNRVTASATYHDSFREGGIWATTVAWGRNEESDEATSGLLVETNVTLDDRDTWFGRFEIARKTAHDLALHDLDDTFTVSKLQGGYTRYLRAWKGWKPGIGGALSAAFVPAALEGAYRRRVNTGVGLFLTLRPAAMSMMHGMAAHK